LERDGCQLRVIRDGAESTANPAMSAMPQWRPEFAAQGNDAMEVMATMLQRKQRQRSIRQTSKRRKGVTALLAERARCPMT
jgi:hypothetical protein